MAIGVDWQNDVRLTFVADTRYCKARCLASNRASLPYTIKVYFYISSIYLFLRAQMEITNKEEKNKSESNGNDEICYHV